ncbi:MAG: adenylyl-sulfate kinase [Clostridia bacterium]|nr:adenylyl-sulfate kinase [Clostridia bacterium]
MSGNIFYSKGNVNKMERETLAGHKGGVFWFFGLSGSGKSAISRGVEENLIKAGINAFRLDGDNLRSGLNSDLGFSKEDRFENIRRAAESAKLLAEAGVVVLATFITPLEENRKTAKDILKSYYNGIYVKCSLDTCIKRDPKGLYKKAMDGIIPDFTGISAPFEEPGDDVYTINTDMQDEAECINVLTEHIIGIIK